MRVALIVDAYRPFRSSAAIQMEDLANEFALQGNDVIVITPSGDQKESWSQELIQGVMVLRLAAPQTKNIGRFRRAFAELMLPLFMIWNLRKSPIKNIKIDAIVWYSPTIFFGMFVHYLKFINNCKCYLILRDIFPDITVDLGILKPGLIYNVFKKFEYYQYSLADTIGVQSPANIEYLFDWSKKNKIKLEVLNNWQALKPIKESFISKTMHPLLGKKIIVYAGNMGLMQGFDIVIQLAERLQLNDNVAILLVGRGTELPYLKFEVEKRCLKNLIFHEEIDPTEVPGLLKECYIGLLILDPKLKTHNFPGKLISYMQAGLPILARINYGNDLYDLIKKNKIGYAYTGEETEAFFQCAENLINNNFAWEAMSINCKNKVSILFGVSKAYEQIFETLKT